MDTQYVLRLDPIISKDGDVTNFVADFINLRLKHFLGDSLNLARVPFDHEAANEGMGKVVVLLTTKNPLLDIAAISELVEHAKRTNAAVTWDGAIPGTLPISVKVASATVAPKFHRTFTSQFEFNSQLNLHKLKRLKIFMALVRKHKDLHTWTVSKVMEYFSSQEGTKFILSYGEDVPLEKYQRCPNCDSEHSYPLQCGEGQPRIGFLTRQSEYYFQCGQCRLVYLNPVLPENELHRLYDWYDKETISAYDKSMYSSATIEKTSYSQNFRHGIDRYASKLPELARTLDVGGGQGQFSVMLKRSFPKYDVHTLDFDCSSVVKILAEHDVKAVSQDFTSTSLGNKEYDMVTMWEVVEHLKVSRLKELWTKIYQALKPGGFFVFSTPDFESEYAQTAEFWAAFVPHHMTVLSRTALEPMWKKAGFDLVAINAESLLFKDGYGDYDYMSSNSASLSGRGDAHILGNLLKVPALNDAHKAWMQSEGKGGEMIVCLQRPLN